MMLRGIFRRMKERLHAGDAVGLRPTRVIPTHFRYRIVEATGA